MQLLVEDINQQQVTSETESVIQVAVLKLPGCWSKLQGIIHISSKLNILHIIVFVTTHPVSHFKQMNPPLAVFITPPQQTYKI